MYVGRAGQQVKKLHNGVADLIWLRVSPASDLACLASFPRRLNSYFHCATGMFAALFS